MDKKEFLAFCKLKEYSANDIAGFEKAADFAADKFAGKERLSSGLVSYHNLMVGFTLADVAASPECIVAGLLHGLESFKRDINELFGSEILNLVVSVAQIKDIKSKNSSLQAEALKNILVTTITDSRIIIIKLANEVENFRNIEYLPVDLQNRIAEEAMEIYAPLAYRLGSEKFRVKLENSAFKILNHAKYEEINKFLKASQEQREKQISEAIESIKSLSKDNVSLVKIAGRPKHIYSIYRKMILKGTSLDKQSDLLGIRIVLKDEKACYTALALLHENFETIDNRIKDYIAAPKENLYRSIHTDLKLPNDKIVEVQIRTKEMDEFAEEGLAAHWKYKGLKSEEKFEKRVGWLKEVLKLQKSEGNKEFIESAKIDVFSDRIYCYTPKGDVKDLPHGANLLDFAFLVHEHVGYKAVAGKVNGKFVPLKYELNKGDVVEILTNKKQRPHRSWLRIVKTANARQKIRKALKEHEKLPAIHYKPPTIKVASENTIQLVESKEFNNAVCILAKCCNPIPGNEITGIPTKRRVISVHDKACRQALKEVKRWTKVDWKNSFSQKLKFYVHAKERSGLLADLLNTIVTAGFEVKEAKAKPIGNEYMECQFLVAPKRLDALVEMIKQVRKLKGVKRILFEG